MLFKREILAGIGAGRITLAFRRWRRPSVKAGSRLRTAAGVLAIKSVETTSPDRVTVADAKRAGFASLADLMADLERQGDGTLHCIAFRLDGADPRIALRGKATLSGADRAAIAERLARMDRDDPWTYRVLALIGLKPGTRAADLAVELGESDLKRFKTRVRRLKELGLTESLEVGYRLSPRGRSYWKQTPGHDS
jgi:hypothetical protein